MPTWEFPSNNHGQIYGISDSGVETFLGTPIRSLAREICQNSLDAAIDNDKPAHVSFSTFDLNTSTLPDIVGLRSAFQNALDFWSLQNSDKTKKFFRGALSVADKPTVTCLRISDFNTKIRAVPAAAHLVSVNLLLSPALHSELCSTVQLRKMVMLHIKGFLALPVSTWAAAIFLRA